MTTVHHVATAQGPARAHVDRPATPRGLAVLGHGAGPSLAAVDLVAARAALVDAGWVVVLVEQPWLVAGRRVASAPPRLDAAWVAVVTALRGTRGAVRAVPGPLLLAGRSAGARVACRTAAALDAAAVLCLAFPLHPPGRPGRSRADELLAPLAAGRRVGVVQGEADPFGTPAEVSAHVEDVYAVPGTHTIPGTASGAVRAAVVGFVAGLGE